MGERPQQEEIARRGFGALPVRVTIGGNASNQVTIPVAP